MSLGRVLVLSALLKASGADLGGAARDPDLALVCAELESTRKH